MSFSSFIANSYFTSSAKEVSPFSLGFGNSPSTLIGTIKRAVFKASVKRFKYKLDKKSRSLFPNVVVFPIWPSISKQRTTSGFMIGLSTSLIPSKSGSFISAFALIDVSSEINSIPSAPFKKITSFKKFKIPSLLGPFPMQRSSNSSGYVNLSLYAAGIKRTIVSAGSRLPSLFLVELMNKAGSPVFTE